MIINELKYWSYTFATNYGTFDDRFILKYKNTLSTDNYIAEDNLVKIGTGKNQINIFALNENLKSVEVFDIVGRRIYSNNSINKKTIFINDISANNQVLIVKVNLENGVVISKKIIGQ